MRYGYIMEGITPGTEKIMAEKMMGLGCDTVVTEKACNGFKRVSWKKLIDTIKQGDELVCYDISHLAGDSWILREVKSKCVSKKVKLFSMEGLKAEDGLIHQKGLHVIDEILSFMCGSNKRLMCTVIGLREQVEEDFPNASPTVREKIYACFCLAQGIPEGYFYQATGKYAPEYTRRMKQWMQQGYRSELKGAARRHFEEELSLHQKMARMR